MGKNEKYEPITSIALLLTEDCNFRCEYCFIDKNPKKINWNTIKKTVDWFSSQNINNEGLHINFFGGEPMLEYELLKKTVLYSTEVLKDNFNYGITTNGALFNKEKLDFFEKHNIGVLFSIDGPEHVQNIHRVKANGEGTFKDIEFAMKEVVKRGLSKTGRPTYTPKTLPYLFDTVKYLLEEVGFETVAPTPAVDSFIEFTADDLEEYDRQFDKIDRYFKDRILMGKNPGMNYYGKCFRQIMFDKKMISPCGAGKKYIAVNTEGDISPCHRFVQWPEWKIGDVENGIYETEIRNMFKNFDNNKTSPECLKCENKFCGGGCFAVNYSKNNSIYNTDKISCELTKRQWDRAKILYDEIGKSKSFHQAYKSLIKRAPKTAQEKIGFNEDDLKQKIYESEPSQKNESFCGNNKKEYQELKNRIDKLEEVIKSMSNVLLDIAEGGN